MVALRVHGRELGFRAFLVAVYQSVHMGGWGVGFWAVVHACTFRTPSVHLEGWGECLWISDAC